MIKMKELSKWYGETRALDNITLSIGENKIVGLVGRNGAGKTTLLKLISGDLRPSAGTINVFGTSPFNNLTVSGHSILIDDRLPIVPTLTINEILEMMARFYPQWNSDLARRLVDHFELNPHARPHALSKGKRSTLYTILGICTRSPLTMLDEPTLGMDKAVRRDIYRVILKEYLRHPRTMIISTHLLSEVEEILEEVILLDRGRVRLYSTVEQMDQMLIQLRGRKEALSPVLETRYVFEERAINEEIYTVVVKNELTEEIRQSLKKENVDFLPIPIDDACVYLTRNGQGAVDDVFK